MYQLLAKKGQMFAIGLGVLVSAIFLGSVFSGLSSAGYGVGDDLNEIMKNNPDQTFDFFNAGIILTLGLIGAALILGILFGLYQLISSPKNSLKGIIGVAVIAALFFAIYSSASADKDVPSIAKLLGQFNVSDNVSKLITGGIMTTLILAGLSLASMVLLEVYNLFK